MLCLVWWCMLLLNNNDESWYMILEIYKELMVSYLKDTYTEFLHQWISLCFRMSKMLLMNH